MNLWNIPTGQPPWQDLDSGLRNEPRQHWVMGYTNREKGWGINTGVEAQRGNMPTRCGSCSFTHSLNTYMLLQILSSLCLNLRPSTYFVIGHR